MNIQLQGTDVDLTDDLREFVERKLDDAIRAFGDMNLEPVTIDVELERTTRHHEASESLYRAEANVHLPQRFLRAEAEAGDIQNAVVDMKHKLTRKIRSWRERLIDERRSSAREAKEMIAQENPDEEEPLLEEEGPHLEEPPQE